MSNNEALLVAFIWAGFVALATAVGIGFAGGVREAFVDNPTGWIFTASPVAVFGWWLWRCNRNTRP